MECIIWELKCRLEATAIRPGPAKAPRGHWADLEQAHTGVSWRSEMGAKWEDCKTKINALSNKKNSTPKNNNGRNVKYR